MTSFRTLASLVVALPLAAPLLTSGCGGGDASPDAAAAIDAFTPATEDAGGPGADAAMGADDAATASSDAGTSDAGAPSTAVVLTGMGMSQPMDRAFLGYERTGTDITALYVELSRGADDACPSETSPVPSQLVTIDHIALTAPGTVTETDGVAARFFDFEGTFRVEIAPATGTMASVTASAVDLVGGRLDGSVAITFDDGTTAVGPFVATHCDSLDVAAM